MMWWISHVVPNTHSTQKTELTNNTMTDSLYYYAKHNECYYLEISKDLNFHSRESALLLFSPLDHKSCFYFVISCCIPLKSFVSGEQKKKNLNSKYLDQKTVF